MSAQTSSSKRAAREPSVREALRNLGPLSRATLTLGLAFVPAGLLGVASCGESTTTDETRPLFDGGLRPWEASRHFPFLDAEAEDGGADGASGDAPSGLVDATLGDAEGTDADAAAPPDGDLVLDGSDDGGDADAGPTHPVALENALAGDVDWTLSNPATAREIEGYASATSVAPGETILFYVSTPAAAYRLEVYRLGWYGGAGARKVASAVTRQGRLQVTPTPDPDGLVECAWSDPHTLIVPANWVTGMYLAKLTTGADGGLGKQSYVPFVVRDDTRRATYLFQSSVTTFQAYNDWGGRSLYDYNSVGGVRAQRVSFLRPYAIGAQASAAAGVGAGEILTNTQPAASSGPMGWELPMLLFLEREGYDVAYVTNIDVDRDPELVARHRVFLSVGHDEYWTARMRDHVEAARDRSGTSLAFFSGNESYWQVRLEPGKGGAERATLVCHKGEGTQSTDPVLGTAEEHTATVLFRDALLARGEEGLSGVAFQDYGVDGDVIVQEPSSWVFAGTGLARGGSLAGLLGYEFDGVPSPPRPGVLPITRSPWQTTRATSGYSQMATRWLPSGAETFAAGSIQFAWGLDDTRPPGVTQSLRGSSAAKTIARNVLSRLAQPAQPRRSLRLFEDDFAGPIDPLRWSSRSMNEGADAFDPLVAVQTSGGRLTVTPRSNVTDVHHGGLVSAQTFALRCGSVEVTLVEATSPTSTANTTFAVGTDASNYYRFILESGVLLFQEESTNGRTHGTIPYVPLEHQKLRLRHDCVRDVVSFETSDGTTWTERRSVPRTVELDVAFVELEAGTYQAESSPGRAVFDDVRVDLGGVREGFTAQREPERFTPGSLNEGDSAFDPEVEVFVSGGRLHIRPRVNVGGLRHAGWVTTRAFDLRGGEGRIVVEQATRATSEASTTFALARDTGNWARASISAGGLFFQLRSGGGAVSSTSVPHDPVLHRHLRIRHEVATDAVVWETSSDGTTWTERRRAPRPFPFDAILGEIEAGSYRPEALPGEAIVDDFVLGR